MQICMRLSSICISEFQQPAADRNPVTMNRIDGFVQDSSSWLFYPHPSGLLRWPWCHYSDVIMSVTASQTTGVSIVFLAVCPSADQRKRQSSASLAFWVGNPPVTGGFSHKGLVTGKMFPFDDVLMAIVRLPRWQWSIPEEYGSMDLVIPLG